LSRESHSLLQQANAITVTNAEDYGDAATVLKGVKTLRKRVSEEFGPAVKAAHQAHKTMKALEQKFDLPLVACESRIKTTMAGWERAERERARAEEERLRAEAQRAEEDRRIKEAEALESAGKSEAAEQLLNAPVPATAVVVKPSVPKVDGVSTRETWKFEIVNEDAIPREYMMPDEKKIGAHVRSMKRRANIPGVEPYPETSVSATGY
jgi:hypothetical protein